ncbi:MAG: D-alanyl-D-alanine carboxypeptidase family protein [Bacillota bacterium]
MRGRKIIFLIVALLFGFGLNSVSFGFSIDARAAILMDPLTGKILYAQNEHQRLPPASVTKVMTMLLIMEAVHQRRVTWDEMIRTSATASRMGGSQVYLKEGEEYPLRDMFKAIAVVSANDASAAVAEHLYGSIQDFVEAMNEKAKVLGLKDTHFANETGLPDPEHYSSAYDLAVISRQLIAKYPEVLKFTSIWLDTFRSGQFTLRNTNELIRVYRGADGLKTGHTEEAKFCLSATAKKGDFRLLSVILGAVSDAKRVAETKRLLDFGYRNFQWKLLQKAGSRVGKVNLKDASPKQVPVKIKADFGAVVERGGDQLIKTRLVPKKNLRLPLKPGTVVATYQATVNGKVVGATEGYSTIKVNRANFLVRWWRSLWDLIHNLWPGKKS